MAVTGWLAKSSTDECSRTSIASRLFKRRPSAVVAPSLLCGEWLWVARAVRASSSSVAPHPGSGADLADLDGGSNSEASGASSNSSDLLRRAGGSVITWSAPEFHYHEEDEVTQMDIVRIGDVSTCVEVEYSTKGGSAKTDKDFTSASGLLRFDVGERHKRIFVHITDNVSWGPDVYFFVNLGTPLHFEAGSSEQDRGPGVPGKCCLVTTKVWIVNDDAYPGGCPKTASPEILAMAFFKERIMARGNKVTVTAYCYVYKAAYDVIITTFALIFIFQAAADLEKFVTTSPSRTPTGVASSSKPPAPSPPST